VLHLDILARVASASEEGAGGVIRSVDVHVAVGTRLVVRKANRSGVGDARNGPAVAGWMTLLAQTRPRHFEHLLLVAAVRIVAVGTTFRHRNVLPQERTTLRLVTLVARLVRR